MEVRKRESSHYIFAEGMRESELRELHIVEATVVESFTEGYRLNTNHACQTSQPFNPFPSSFVVRTEGVSATLLSP